MKRIHFIETSPEYPTMFEAFRTRPRRSMPSKDAYDPAIGSY